MRLSHSGRRRLFLLFAVGSALVVVYIGSTLAIRHYVFRQLRPGPLPFATPPSGLPALTAESCGACHLEIYAEWRRSSMARAFTNPVFQTDWEENGHFFFCLNCHAPLENQQPELTSTLASLKPMRSRARDNPRFDRRLQAEGITCVVCHLRDGALVGPHGGEAAPHSVRRDEFIRSAAACAHCHQFEAPPFAAVERAPSDTNAEWDRWRRRTRRTESCVDCHMPEITRPSAAGAPARPGRRHTWPGGRDPDFLRAGLDLSSPRREHTAVVVELTNLAGHAYPTGEPARALEVIVTLLDEEGQAFSQRERWLARRILLPQLEEIEDTTLRAAERRTLRFSFDGADVERSFGVRAEVYYHRLHHLAKARERAGLTVTDQRILIARTQSASQH